MALDVAETIKRAGASVLLAHTLKDGLRLADHADLSAAVLDFGLIDGQASELCQRLNGRACRTCSIAAIATSTKPALAAWSCQSPLLRVR